MQQVHAAAVPVVIDAGAPSAAKEPAAPAVETSVAHTLGPVAEWYASHVAEMPVQPAVDTAKMTPCDGSVVYVVVEYAMPAAVVVPGETPELYATVVSVFQLPLVVSESVADAASVPPVAIVVDASKFHDASTICAAAGVTSAANSRRRMARPRGRRARRRCARRAADS